MSFYVTDESQLAERHKMQSTYARPLSYHEHDVTQMNVSLLKAELKDMSSDRDVLRDELAKVTIQYTIFFFLRPFPYLGSAHRVFNLHFLWSCGSSIFTWFSFMSFLITSLHLSFGLPILRCPPTSMFSFLQSSSAFLSTLRNHLSLASLIFSLVFATLALISSFLDLPNPLYSHHNTQYAIQSNLFQLPYMSMISIH